MNVDRAVADQNTLETFLSTRTLCNVGFCPQEVRDTGSTLGVGKIFVVYRTCRLWNLEIICGYWYRDICDFFLVLLSFLRLMFVLVFHMSRRTFWKVSYIENSV